MAERRQVRLVRQHEEHSRRDLVTKQDLERVHQDLLSKLNGLAQQIETLTERMERIRYNESQPPPMTAPPGGQG